MSFAQKPISMVSLYVSEKVLRGTAEKHYNANVF